MEPLNPLDNPFNRRLHGSRKTAIKLKCPCEICAKRRRDIDRAKRQRQRARGHNPPTYYRELAKSRARSTAAPCPTCSGTVILKWGHDRCWNCREDDRKAALPPRPPPKPKRYCDQCGTRVKSTKSFGPARCANCRRVPDMSGPCINCGKPLRKAGLCLACRKNDNYGSRRTAAAARRIARALPGTQTGRFTPEEDAWVLRRDLRAIHIAAIINRSPNSVECRRKRLIARGFSLKWGA